MTRRMATSAAQVMIQFGYVTFFSMAFPLAPLCAMVNNFAEMRCDAFKLCHISRRPPAVPAEGIGVWLTVLRIMSAMAVVTNCMHIGVTSDQVGRFLPGITEAGKVWVRGISNNTVVAVGAPPVCNPQRKTLLSPRYHTPLVPKSSPNLMEIAAISLSSELSIAPVHYREGRPLSVWSTRSWWSSS